MPQNDAFFDTFVWLVLDAAKLESTAFEKGPDLVDSAVDQIGHDEAGARIAGRDHQIDGLRLIHALAGLRMLGAIETRDRTIRLTESGYYLWVILMREFFSGVNNFRDGMRHSIRDEKQTSGTDYG